MKKCIIVIIALLYSFLNVNILFAATETNLYGTFADAGIWKWDGSAWNQVTPSNPEALAIGTNLYGDFGSSGIWKWDGSAWSQITPGNPQMMAVSDLTLYGAFTGSGIWKLDGSIWSQVTSSNPEAIVASGSNLYGDFGSSGIWKWDGATWSQVTPNAPELMSATGSLLYGAFEGGGIWKWDGSSWTQVTPSNPESIIASGSLLYGDFGSSAIWQWDGTIWSQVTPNNPQLMSATGSLLYGAFAGGGIWKWDGSTWSQVTPNNPVSMFASTVPTQIIADHTIVEKYNLIPQRFIDEIKKMWINIPGESHSQAYRTGMTLLMGLDSKFAANVIESGSPELPTNEHLRVSQFVRESWGWGSGSGEAGWYTWYAYPLESQPAVKDRIKNHIQYSKNNNMNLTAVGFGWCWDTTWTNSPGGTIDPVYNVRWAGSSDGGPDGNKIWGLDDDDYSLTGNRVNMNTYLNATEDYRLFALSIGAPTKVIFTTTPVDGYTGESGYQRYLKHEHIRNFVRANSARILFDYADILSYDDNGVVTTKSWTDTKSVTHTYPAITTTNAGDGSVGHIGSAGAIRLAKAQWWMLARIAGWDGVSP